LARSEIGIENLKCEKIISFSRQNLSFTERHFTENSRSTIARSAQPQLSAPEDEGVSTSGLGSGSR